jgi:hypothetical protein
MKEIKYIISCLVPGSGTVINYGSGSGSDFFTSYGSGSGSTSQKVTVPTVPVPVPQHCRYVFIQCGTGGGALGGLGCLWTIYRSYTQYLTRLNWSMVTSNRFLTSK